MDVELHLTLPPPPPPPPTGVEQTLKVVVKSKATNQELTTVVDAIAQHFGLQCEKEARTGFRYVTDHSRIYIIMYPLIRFTDAAVISKLTSMSVCLCVTDIQSHF